MGWVRPVAGQYQAGRGPPTGSRRVRCQGSVLPTMPSGPSGPAPDIPPSAGADGECRGAAAAWRA